MAVYLASPSEISIDQFIEHALDRGVRAVAPRWNGKAYELAELTGLDDGRLRPGPMGIREPAEPRIVSPECVDTWIVPGLAFTKDGKRLGYGGGWYDRLMAKARDNAVRLAVAYTFQIVDDIPDEPHDVRLTGVIDDA